MVKITYNSDKKNSVSVQKDKTIISPSEFYYMCAELMQCAGFNESAVNEYFFKEDVKIMDLIQEAEYSKIKRDKNNNNNKLN